MNIVADYKKARELAKTDFASATILLIPVLVESLPRSPNRRGWVLVDGHSLNPEVVAQTLLRSFNEVLYAAE